MISSRDENESSPYKKLLPEIQQQIEEDRANKKENPYCCNDDSIIRRNPERDKANLWRPAFVRDTEKILHLPVYNRYADKTQVFSLFKNDDITRRALHVQLVSRIARSIGNVLGLNTDLIEAVALGHDIGHTPFGHAGERFLSDLLHGETGIFFNHNVHSVRVLDVLSDGMFLFRYWTEFCAITANSRCRNTNRRLYVFPMGKILLILLTGKFMLVILRVTKR